MNGSLEAHIPPSEEDRPHTSQQENSIVSRDPLAAATSLEDNGQAKRPRDARLLHIILASLGVQAYQERAPLQLMDFAYRYTSSTLQDALHLAGETPGASVSSTRNSSSNDLSAVTLQALRLAIASRQHYQFQAILPKEHFQEMAAEKNKIALPTVNKGSHIRLPPERYCLTGVAFGIGEYWEDGVDNEADTDLRRLPNAVNLERTNGIDSEDNQMSGVERIEKLDRALAEDEEMVDA